MQKSVGNELQYQLIKTDSAKLCFEVKNLPRKVIEYTLRQYVSSDIKEVRKLYKESMME